MKIFKSVIFVLAFFLLASGIEAQKLTAAQKTAITQRAEPLYYSPTAHGFVSIACDVKLDWDTVPKAMLVPAELAGRDHLRDTKLHFTMNLNGTPKITHEYAESTPVLIKPVYDKFFEWASSVVNGFFMTWGSKAMRSPIPTGHYVSSLIADQDGYRLVSNSGEAVIVLSLSKDYVITRILTTGSGQTIDEHPKYTSSPQGLLFTSNDAENKTNEGTTHIAYDVAYRPVDTIIFPHEVHLVVDSNIDMKFNLDNCSVERGTVVKATPTN